MAGDPGGGGGTNGAPAREPRAGRCLVSARAAAGKARRADPERSEATRFRHASKEPYRPSTATGTRCARGASRPSGWRSSPRGSPASCPRPSCSSGSMPAPTSIRLAGTRLCELFGSELRGRNFLDGWSEAGPPACSARDLAHDLRAGRGRRPQRRRRSSDDRHRVELEAILLPLVHAGNKIGRIIGAMSADVGALLARQRAPAQPPPHAPRADLAGWAAARGGRAARAAGAVPCRRREQMRIVKTGRRQFRVFEGGRTTASTTSARCCEKVNGVRRFPLRRRSARPQPWPRRLARNGAAVRASLNQSRHSRRDRSLTGPVLPADCSTHGLVSDRQPVRSRCFPST